MALELNTIHLGDCLDLMSDIPDGSVDMICTDPPWMNYKTGRYDASEWHRPMQYVSPERYASDLYRVSKINSVCILWLRWDVFELHRMHLEAAGFRVKNQIVWAKNNHTAGDLEGNLGNKHECACFAVKGDWVRHGPREVNLWHIPHLFSRARRINPNEKPVRLFERCIKLGTKTGDLVLDPFIGSGTTAIAAIDTGRQWLGIEKDLDYHRIATERVAQRLKQPFLPGIIDPPEPQPEQAELWKQP